MGVRVKYGLYAYTVLGLQRVCLVGTVGSEDIYPLLGWSFRHTFLVVFEQTRFLFFCKF